MLTMRERWMRKNCCSPIRAIKPFIVSRIRCTCVAGVDADVVAFGFDPVDRVDVDERYAAAGFHQQALGGRGSAGPQQFRQSLRQFSLPIALEMLACSRERGLKPLPAERLQQVIDRLHFERADGVFVVGGHEDRRRHAIDADGLDHLEAIHAGHLQIEKHEIGRRMPDRIPRPPARTRRSPATSTPGSAASSETRRSRAIG